MYTPIITENLLKNYSPIGDDTFIRKFLPYISIMQKMYIEPIIGIPLMRELQEQVKANNLSDENKELILKIAPALSLFTVYKALPFHWISILNKGVTLKDSPNSRAVSIDDIAQLRRWILDDANAYLNLIPPYLCENSDKYPLWTERRRYCGCHEAGYSSNSAFFFG